jgi:DNA-binding NarL/FixJ family response regulator
MVTDEQIRVLIVDDDHDVRCTLASILATDPAMKLVAKAADGRQALLAASAHSPDVIVLDIRMPTLDGLTTLERLQQDGTTARIVMLTTFGDGDNVRRAIAAGAAGFLLKSGDPQELLQAIHGTQTGETWLAPQVAGFVAQDVRRHLAGKKEATEAARTLSQLTSREREVAELLARGLSNQEIGQELFLTESTVKAYVSTALDRLGRRNRVELASLVWAARAVEGTY